MEVRFRTRQLARAYEQSGEAARRWGPTVGARYVQRVDLLQEAKQLVDLFAIRALALHPLVGGRRGQYALRLTGQQRLVLTVEGEAAVTVEEVVDYHG